jgi:hypothetical protein
LVVDKVLVLIKSKLGLREIISKGTTQKTILILTH